MGDTEDLELPRVLTLLWGLDEPARRGPKPGLRITSIGAAAVGIADAEGLGAVSMSRLAGELGFTTMSLYRYVDAKDDLYAVMLDTAYGRPELGNVGTGWRAWMAAWCRVNRAVLLQHPWIVQIPVREPPLTPNLLAWMEQGLQALSRTRLSEQEKLSSLLLADVYVRGQTQLAAGLAGSDARLTPGETGALYTRRFTKLVDAESYPAICAAVARGSLEDEGDFAEQEFLFGLNTVLDGIAALVGRKRRIRS